MLTPENVQIHSQGAALLLVWAANTIKQYAAYKWVGDDLIKKPQAFSNLTASYKKKDLQQITIETKIALRQKKRKEKEAFDEKRKKDNPDDEEGEEDDEDNSGDEDDEEGSAKKPKKEKKEEK